MRFALVAALAAGAALAGDVVEVANRDLDELSGLAVSRRDATVLWGHNDTGGGAVLYRIGPSGEDLGGFPVEGARAYDWEDIAAFEHDGAPALLVADTGDNFALRSEASLYAVSDPGREGAPALLWRLRFRYPDGARDCEAAAVDMAAREVLLVSKRDARPRLYRVPLPQRTPQGVQTAEFLGEVGGLPEPAASLGTLLAWLSPYRDSPTALAVSRDGLTAVLVTYRRAYLYRREPSMGWAKAFEKPVASLQLPPGLDQVEAAALSPDGRELIVGSEGSPARFARIALPQDATLSRPRASARTEPRMS